MSCLMPASRAGHARVREALPPFLPWLALAAVGEWLIVRTLTRSAIFMPKSPPILAGYQLLTHAGQLIFTFTGLLALIGLGWLAWRMRSGGRYLLALTLVGLIGLSLTFLVVAPAGWPAVGYHLLLLAAILLIGREARLGIGEGRWWWGKSTWVAWLVPATALLTAKLYLAGEALNSALRLPGPAPLTSLLFNSGEFLVVSSGFALWWAYGRRGSPPWVWFAAALPALAFSAMYLLSPTMTGIIVIWSLGLTLYLPWPLYAASLWLAGTAAMASLHRRDSVGWAILLLVAGGYLPQLSTQAFLGLMALYLLASPNALKGYGGARPRQRLFSR